MSFALDGLGLAHANGTVALADIGLAARQGENIALIGPSGAGKTSLLSVLGTAWSGQPGLQGAVRVLDSDLSALQARVLQGLRARIGTVHQAPPLPARQRVVTSVLAGRLGQWPAWKALASLAYPMDIAGARAALARVELEDKLFVRCDQLSGGQLQRAGIARVLYQQAALVLADEPVSALDPALALATVRLLVADAAQRGATLVASLHAVNVAEAAPNGFDVMFGDYLLMYSALAGPEAAASALDAAQSLPATRIDDGDSRSYLLAWLLTHQSQ